MTGAIEFLRKAKAICNDEDFRVGEGVAFMIIDCIMSAPNALTEADLVRKVMDYRLEDKDGERN